MMNRVKAYSIGFLVSIYLTRKLTFSTDTNFRLGVFLWIVLIVAVELIVHRWKQKKLQKELANRRDCMVIAESWPDSNADGPFLGDLYEGLYIYLPAKEVTEYAKEYRQGLIDAGNNSLAPGLHEDLVLPVVTLFHSCGANRMESRSEYGERLKKKIKEINNRYHEAYYSQNEGRNYELDYLTKRDV